VRDATSIRLDHLRIGGLVASINLWTTCRGIDKIAIHDSLRKQFSDKTTQIVPRRTQTARASSCAGGDVAIGLYETRDPCLLTSRHHGRSRGRGGLRGHPVVECRRILFQCVYLRLIVRRRGKREREVEWDQCPDQRKRREHRTRRVAWETNRERASPLNKRFETEEKGIGDDA
jgi:hypothetical protein